MIGFRNVWGLALALALVSALLLGCGGKTGDTGTPAASTGGETAGAAFPSKDPGEPFTVGEKGTVVLTNDRAYEIRVNRDDGDPLYVLPLKRTTVIDPSVPFTVRTFEGGLSEESSARYAAVGTYVLELHAAEETGYGFALKPLLTIHYTSSEIDAARQEGAPLDPLKGNLLVLYKEQRAPTWVPQTSVSVNEDAQTVTVSNIAGAGAWRLVAKKIP